MSTTLYSYLNSGKWFKAVFYIISIIESIKHCSNIPVCEVALMNNFQVVNY